MSAVEKPRYRVKARRSGVVVELPPASANPDTMDVLDQFRAYIEERGAQAVAMVAIARNGDCMTQYQFDRNFHALLGALDSLRHRMNTECDE